MKKLFILLVVALSLSACDKDLLETSFTTDLSVTSDEIVVGDTPINTQKIFQVPYETEFTLDLSNPDTQEYLDRIKEIDLSEAKLNFLGLESLSGNTASYELYILFDNQYLIQIPNFNFDMVAQGDPIMITDQETINNVADILLNRKKVQIKVYGYLPANDIYRFHIRFSTKAKITAKVL